MRKYYDKKFREHVEMVECYCWLVKVIVIGALVVGLWRLLFG